MIGSKHVAKIGVTCEILGRKIVFNLGAKSSEEASVISGLGRIGSHGGRGDRVRALLVGRLQL